MEKVFCHKQTYWFPEQCQFWLSPQALIIPKLTIALFIVRIRFVIVHRIPSHFHFTKTWLLISMFCNRLPTFSCVFCRQLFVVSNDQSISSSVNYWFGFTRNEVIRWHFATAFGCLLALRKCLLQQNVFPRASMNVFINRSFKDYPD